MAVSAVICRRTGVRGMAVPAVFYRRPGARRYTGPMPHPHAGTRMPPLGVEQCGMPPACVRQHGARRAGLLGNGRRPRVFAGARADQSGASCERPSSCNGNGRGHGGVYDAEREKAQGQAGRSKDRAGAGSSSAATGCNSPRRRASKTGHRSTAAAVPASPGRASARWRLGGDPHRTGDPSAARGAPGKRPAGRRRRTAGRGWPLRRLSHVRTASRRTGGVALGGRLGPRLARRAGL